MKTRLLHAAFLLYIGIANAAIMRCYKCVSSSSWDHCNDSQVVEDCLSDEEQCAQFLIQAYDPVSGSSKANYLKGCASKRVCHKRQTSKVCEDFRRRNSGARISCQVFCSSGNRSNEGKPPDLCKPGYYCLNGNTDLSLPCRYGTYQPFDGQTSSSSCIQCPNAAVLNAEPLTSCLTDRPFTSSSLAKSAGEIVGGVVGSLILLVVAYVVVQKRRRRGNTNAFTDMLDLAYNLQKDDKELLEEQEQEESSTAKQLRFSY